MKQRTKVKWEEMLPQDKIILSDAVTATAEVERVIDMPMSAWHPLVAKIVDVMCAADPENGSGVIGGHDHSHDPSKEECYWAYNVGPQVATLFAEVPDSVLMTERIEEVLGKWEAVATALEGSPEPGADKVRRALRESARAIRKAMVQ